jgi:hypothetical protein
VNEELLLVALEGIGCVRTRALYSARSTDGGKMAKASEQACTHPKDMAGVGEAKGSIKEEVGAAIVNAGRR